MSRHITAPVAVLLAAGLIAGCTASGEPSGTGGETPAPDATVTVTVAPSGAVAPAPTPMATTPVSVFFLDGLDVSARLAREPHDVASETSGRGAVQAMLAGPDDPDYFSPWNRATSVLGISNNDGLIIVDLSSEARVAEVEPETAELMQQQLIYTITEQLGVDKKVLLHVDGEPAGSLWGGLEWTSPLGRGDWRRVLALVSIERPVEGADVRSPVTVTGEAAVDEATLPWRVFDLDGEVVLEGSTNTTEGNAMAPYSFEVTLPPGSYMIEVREDSATEFYASDDRSVIVTG